MELYIAPKNNSPEIIFSPDENIFRISGISLPEDVKSFYSPVMEWLEIFVNDVLDGEYKFSNNNPLKFVFCLQYFNSSSAKFIFDIITELKKLIEDNIAVIIEWQYEKGDPDQKEAGEEISELAGVNFSFTEINS